MIKEITTYIQNGVTGSPTLTIDSNLFAGHVPADNADDAVGVIETPAGSSNFYLPDAVEKTIQIFVRANTYMTARDYSQRIYDFLHGKAGVSLPIVSGGKAYLVNVIEAVSPPGSIGQNERGQYEFITNYIFRAQDK